MRRDERDAAVPVEEVSATGLHALRIRHADMGTQASCRREYECIRAMHLFTCFDIWPYIREMGSAGKRRNAGCAVALAALLASGVFFLKSTLFAPKAEPARTPGSEPALHVSVISQTFEPFARVSHVPRPPAPVASKTPVEEAPVEGPPLVRDTQTPRLPACPSELRLVGSAVNARRPQLSRVVVRSGQGAFVVAGGGRVGEFVVERIRAASAELRRSDGERCLLTGWTSAPPVEARPGIVAPAEPRVEAKPKALFSRQELTAGVRALGGGDYQVARELLLKGLTNPGGAASGAWFRPHVRDGKSVGMEVRAVRDGSPLAALGIESGDVARSVNGIAIDSPDGLLSALRAVRESSTITISIVRDDRSRDLRYFVD